MHGPRARPSCGSAARRASRPCWKHCAACSRYAASRCSIRGHRAGSRSRSAGIRGERRRAGTRNPRIDELHVLVSSEGYGPPTRPADPRRVRRRDRCRDRQSRSSSAEVSTVSSLVAARDARAALLESTGRGLQETPPVRSATASRGRSAHAGRSTECRSPRVAREDLVDLGRIESGELLVAADDVSIADVVAAALRDTCVAARTGSSSTSQPTLPLVSADHLILAAGARRSGRRGHRRIPAGEPVRIVAGAVWPGVDIRIIDRRKRRTGRSGAPVGSRAQERSSLRHSCSRWAGGRGRRDARRGHDARDSAAGAQ